MFLRTFEGCRFQGRGFVPIAQHGGVQGLLSLFCAFCCLVLEMHLFARPLRDEQFVLFTTVLQDWRKRFGVFWVWGYFAYMVGIRLRVLYILIAVSHSSRHQTPNP